MPWPGSALPPSFSARHCRSLKSVNLRGFQLTAETVGSLARHNNRLRIVKMSDNCTDEMLETLLENTTSLKELEVGVSPGSTGRWMKLLPQKIQRLYIRGEGKYTARAI